MPITQGDVESVLRRVRSYYKGNFKSGNKIYLEDTHPVTGQVDPKRVDRNERAEIVRQRLRDLREIEFSSYAQMGTALLHYDFTYGNCGEMSAVTAQMCAIQLGSQAYAQMNLVGANFPPGDHGFVLLRDHDAPARQFATVHEMAAASVEGYWVVDCWMNIACKAADYLSCARRKAVQWEAQGKAVVVDQDRQTGQVIYMPAKSFVEQFTIAALAYYS